MNIEEIKEKLKTRNLFITGAGGVGKSYLINQLRKELDIEVTSSTGISAINIEGQTIHAWASLGIANTSSYIRVKAIKRNKDKKNLIQNTKYLVIDEVSMVDAHLLNYLNEVLQQVRDNYEPFGGIRIILVGDFYQLPPVKLGGMKDFGSGENKTQILIDYCFNSDAWRSLNLETIFLDKVYRQTDKDFVNALQRIRVGQVTDEDINLLQTRNIPNTEDVPESITRLYSVNEKVDAENKAKLNKLPGQLYTITAKDMMRRYKNHKADLYPAKDLNEYEQKTYDNFCKYCRIPFDLELKVGARVMLLVNDYFDIGLCNGSCGFVQEIKGKMVLVKFDNDETTWIRPYTLEIKEGKKVIMSRCQTPLRLAYATSIHKSQGMSLDKVFIDFDRIFATGQAYVALSRVKSLQGLYIKNFKKECIKTDYEVTKFYNELREQNKISTVK